MQGVNANIITNLADLDINWALVLLFVLHLNMNLDILITRFALPCTSLFSPCVDVKKRPVLIYRPLSLKEKYPVGTGLFCYNLLIIIHCLFSVIHKSPILKEY